MIAVCSCLCGSTDSLLRNFLRRNGYQDWMGITIYKGKEKSRKLIASLPGFDELSMLDNFVSNSSKWAVIIGYDDTTCRWEDISRGGVKSAINAEFLVEKYGND